MMFYFEIILVLFSVWNMEVDYAAYLNLDSIKSRIKEAAIKKLEEKKEELKEKLLEALGLPKVR